MMPDLGKYLEELGRQLRLDPDRRKQVVMEMASHLEERIQELERQGFTRQEAVERAIQRFGLPKALAAKLYEARSSGTWGEALIAAAPHGVLCLLFGLHLWQSLGWLAVFLALSVGVTLVGWWRGKPQWMYPWAGYSLTAPLVSGIIAALAVGKGGLAMFQGSPLGTPVWAYAGLVVYIPLSLWLVVSTVRQVVKKDWLFASLMILPFPVLARWLLSFQMESSALVYARPVLGPEAEEAIALVFLALAAMAVLFVRLRQRRLKIAALVLAAPASFLAASSNIPGSWGLPWMLLFAVAAVGCLLAPALLEARVGRDGGEGLVQHRR